MKPEIHFVGIRDDVKFGNRTRVYQPVNLYGCSIGDDCLIGPFTEIGNGVKIGNKTKIQSHAYLCELVTIGHDCFIGHGVVFINDTFKEGGPAMGDKSKWKETNIGDRVSIGSNSTILPVDICSDVVIGAGAVVTKNITTPGFYAGNPAKLIRAK
jgi:acetyltransferase-like isoleucine patch superfamily enzyme